MKTSIKTIILAAASIFSAMSCQKEAAVPETQSPENAGETIQVNINASLGDLVAADGTKATATSVVRLQWEDGDKVDAYSGTTKISGTDGLTVTPSENGIFAKLTGEITTTDLTSGTSVITFIYSNGCTVSDDGLTFDFTNQTKTGGIPFVAYATLVYDGTATLTGKMVEFKFATSVMKIAATDLGGGKITGVAISGINTKVTLGPSTNKESPNPAITGGPDSPAKDITTDNFSSSPDSTRAIVTVGLVPDNNKGRNISVTQTGFTNKGAITSAEIHSSTSYTTPASLFSCGKIDDHDYVLIAGTKWATRNIGATEDTGTNSYGTYFAWGDTSGQEAGTKPTDGKTASKAFTSGFSTTPSLTSTNPKRLSLENDAANATWGDPWRMPTSAEFKALKDATYWAWDGTDKGYYVYAPQSGDAGKKNNETTNTYDKSTALLFFPAAGRGYSTALEKAGTYGYYWSSTLYSSTDAYHLLFNNGGVIPQQINGSRYLGFSVRPVSDS